MSEAKKVWDQRDEARDLASALVAAFREICDDLGDLAEYDPRLDFDRLPYWLTRQTGAPSEWDRDGEAADDES